MQHTTRPTPVDLTSMNSTFWPTPFYIPNPVESDTEDLTTRLGRAYARMQAFEDLNATEYTSMCRAFAARVMDKIGEQDRKDPTKYNQYAYIYQECVWRDEMIPLIRRALTYEIAKAKEELGQWKCVVPKPKVELAELEGMFL